jgi:23S rRNA (adenine-N6)-dimethyltransferase
VSGARRRAPRRAELGQHVLRRGALAADLVARSSIGPADLVVEIGAGAGALTRPLAARAGRVLAVEVDPRLAAALRAGFAEAPGVQVVERDFFDVPLPRERYAVFGNVPYALTARIVRRLLDAEPPPHDAWLIVQREAAERFAGAPFAAESLQSLLLKPRWHVEIARHLRRTDFDPPPAVESSLLWLAHRDRPLLAAGEHADYERFVRATLGGDATVRAALRRAFTPPQLARLARDLRLDLGARPTALVFGQWLGLFRAWSLLTQPAPGPGRASSRER